MSTHPLTVPQTWPAIQEFNSLQTRLKNHPTEPVCLVGYLGTRRDVSKKLSFAMLRSPKQTHCVQLISTLVDQNGDELESHHTIRSLKDWTPVKVTGFLKERQPAKTEGAYLGMKLLDTLEIDLRSIEPLNSMLDDLIIKEDTVFSSDQRHLQLRTNHALRQNLLARSSIQRMIVEKLIKKDFWHIETPILFKSTPEGAREFLVPTRRKGYAYALPQSPQQYKQLLMASGVQKYFQFARCFRDEDLRADRQPEFTQVCVPRSTKSLLTARKLDLEMAFAGEKEVMHVVEGILIPLWASLTKVVLEYGESFPKMTYQEAMASYGSDKPDLRIDAKVRLSIFEI